MDKTEIARALAGLRPLRRMTCPVCGQQFTGRGRRVYCSPGCRYQAWRHRHGLDDRSDVVEEPGPGAAERAS